MTRIVIVGAGYAGVAVAKKLGQNFAHRGDIGITLINANVYHTFQTELHKVAAGTAAPHDVCVSLQDAMTPYNIQLQIGTVTHIDPRQRVVLVDDQRNIDYDYLVVAMGSQAEYWNIPGLQQHGYVLSGLHAAIHMHKTIQSTIQQAEVAKRRAHFVIGGGGLTGVELAGEMAHVLRGRHHITLIEMADTLLVGQPRPLRDAAQRYLTRHGVTVNTGVGLQEVSAQSALLTNGSDIAFDMLVWAGGVRGHRLVGKTFASDGKDRAYVDGYLRAEEFPNVYIVGDTALAKQAATNEPVPPTAQAALQQADVVADHIIHTIDNKQGLLQPYVGKSKGVLVSVGPRFGLGQWGMLHGAGRTWKWLKDANDMKYRLRVGQSIFHKADTKWEYDDVETTEPGQTHRSYPA